MSGKPFEDVTYRIIGAAMRVHNALGPGLKECTYQRALSIELEKAELGFLDECAVEVYLDQTTVALLYLDHLVEGEVIVEEKAVSHLLTDEEKAQAITYLCATGKSVALLLNFGRERLEHKRIFPPKKLDPWRDRIRRYVWIPPSARSVNSLPNPLTDLRPGRPEAPANPLTAHPFRPPRP